MSPVTRIVERKESAPHVADIRADRIIIDERVQRSLIPARLKKLTDTLDLDALGVITVSERDDGDLIAIDGQHRLAALLAHDMGEWEVTCHVYRKLTLAQEAALFRRLNDTRKITPYDDYSKGLVEGDPECRAIEKILRKHDLQLSPYGADGRPTCVSKMRQLYQPRPKEHLKAGENLDETLGLAIEVWGNVYPAMEKSILGGLGFVLRVYPDANRKSLAEALAKFPGGPQGLLAKGRMMREIRPGSVERLVAAIIVEAYNKRFRGRGKLTPLL